MNHSRKSVLLLLLVLPLLMFMSDEEGGHGSDPMEFVGKVVNFVVLFGGLGYLLYKPLTRFLAKRGMEIDRTIRETFESRRTSETRLQKTRERLELLTGELTEIQGTAEKQGQSEKEAILAASREEAGRLRELARQEIDLVSQNVSRELREYAAELATQGARERLAARLTPKLHARLIDRSIERLEKFHEESGAG